MQAKQPQRYTVKDYRSWSDDIRVELIDGVVYDMAPAPRVNHQRIVRKVFLSIGNFLEGKRCEVFDSPIDVCFSENEDEDVVVQPDIVVVCDPKKIVDHGIVGVPDIVVEVLSPSTATYDLTYKLELYQRVGVPEYWAVSEERRTVFRYVLTNGVYKMEAFNADVMPSIRLSDFTLDIGALFADLPAQEPKGPNR